MTAPKVNAIKIFTKGGGTAFGQELPIEVKCTENYSGRVDLTLCNCFNGNTGDAGGRTSITIKNGVGQSTLRLPPHDGWEGHPAEKNKRPMVEFWLDGSIGSEDEKYSGAKIKVPTLESRQDFVFQILSNESDSPHIEIIGRDGKEVCKATIVTPYGTTSGNSVKIDTIKSTTFYTAKPATDSFSISMENKRILFGKPISMQIPISFLEKGEPLHIAHGLLNPNGFQEMALPKYGGFSNEGIKIERTLSAVQLPSYIEEEEPIIVLDVKNNRTKAVGMQQGENFISNLSEGGKRLLIETIYGDDIVPAAISIKEAKPLFKDFIKGEKFYIKTVNGKDYVIFKGWGGLRQIYKGSRYRLENSMVVSLTACKGIGAALKEGVRGSTGSWLSIVFVCSMDIVKWMQEEEGKKFFSDLLVDICSSTIKSMIGTIAGAVAMALVVLAFSGTAPILAVVAGGVLVGVFVGSALNMIDERLKITEKTKEFAKNCSKETAALYDDSIVKPVSYFLYRLEQEILNLYGINNPQLLR